jgi:glycerol-1-phosphate dehydrogenase [NAD(P)+]
VTADPDDESTLVAVFGTELGRSCWRDFSRKRLDARGAEAVNARLAEGWDRIRGEIARVLRPAADLDRTLQRAGAPRTPEDLGWPRAFYARATANARLIRDRYTFLDLAANTGNAIAP